MYTFSGLAPLLLGIVSLLCGFLLLAPFVVSALLSIGALKELMAGCEKLSKKISQNLKVGSVSVGAIVISVAAIVLGLCWNMAMPACMLYPAAALVAPCILASYFFMTALTWIILPLGLFSSKETRVQLKDDLRALYLFFAAASVPMSATVCVALGSLLIRFVL